MSFDTADLGRMEADGALHDVIAHEMGTCSASSPAGT
jgi:hypothetical protein